MDYTKKSLPVGASRDNGLPHQYTRSAAKNPSLGNAMAWAQTRAHQRHQTPAPALPERDRGPIDWSIRPARRGAK